MSIPVFRLAIISLDTGRVVTLPGGGKLELDLITAVRRRVEGRKVGLFRTKARVSAEVGEALTDVLRDLKQETVKVI